MKILTKSRVFAAAHIPLATAALLGICAADELRGEKTVATSAVPATSDASANGLHCATPQASTGAVLVGPDGRELREYNGEILKAGNVSADINKALTRG